MKIGVIGATGVLGRHLVPRLLERGHTVRAQLRDPARGRMLAGLGVEVVVGDILDPGSLPSAIRGCEIVVNLATALPRPGAPPDWTANDRIRREGTANMLAACVSAGVPRVVQQSIAMLHTGSGDAWVDEDAPIESRPTTASAIDMEALVRESKLDWRIVRGGAFYGPGTGRDEAWRDAARDGSLRLPGDGSEHISLIHVADMASALIAVALGATPRSTWIACDNRPVTYRDLFTHLAALEGGPRPAPGGPPVQPSFRASNRRIRTVLGWRAFYSSYRSGFC
jgi:nucleoside-diphosphate-sugar epimerase